MSKRMRSRGFLALLLWLAVMAIGCPRSRQQTKTPLLAFAAVGEALPFFEGRPIFRGTAPEIFSDLLPLFQERDLILTDLAGGFEFNCVPPPGAQVFRWSPEWLAPLAAAKLRVLNLANDHALDCGPEALVATLSYLLDQGFYVTGAGQDQAEAAAPVYLSQNEITLAVVSFLVETPGASTPCPTCPGPSRYERPALIRALTEMKKRAAYSLVILHWPDRERPQFSDSELAVVKEVFDYGADLILGYGPAGAGGLYRLRGKWMIGSLGRLTGPSSASAIADGLFLSVEFAPDRLMNLRLTPVRLAAGKPALLHGDAAAASLRALLSTLAPENQDRAALIGDILYLK